MRKTVIVYKKKIHTRILHTHVYMYIRKEVVFKYYYEALFLMNLTIYVHMYVYYLAENMPSDSLGCYIYL